MPARHVLNVFAGPYVDRRSDRRKDEAWLAAALDDPSTCYVPVWRTRNLVRQGAAPQAALLARTGLDAWPASEPILLGLYRGRACFAIEIDAGHAPRVAEQHEFTDLRVTGGLLPADEAGLLAYARALVWWRARHRHCGTCGAPTRPGSAGHVMTCSDPGCASEAFPRIDPAIIVLVTDGERALLGRQASWPPGRYSTIAGFVEPGESLEDAVAREVLEETSVPVGGIAYHSSQPWPFPSSLMLGFIALARDTAIACPDGELEDARWFSRADMAAGTPLLPPPQSISFRLIADWYEQGTGRKLADEPGARIWPMPR